MQSRAWVNQLVYLNSCDSTNLEMLRRLDQSEPLPNFSAIVAGEQTGGRGRLDRSWVSEPEGSLAVSILIRPDAVPGLNWLTPAAAMSVAYVVEKQLVAVGLNQPDVHNMIQIKWPNDVLVSGNKISGILAQVHSSGAIVLGIGLNLRAQASAPEQATSLQQLGVVNPNLDEILADLLANFRARAHILMSGAAQVIAKDFRENCVTLGRRVRVQTNDSEFEGEAFAIDDDGRIGVRSATQTRWFAAGDVVHLRN